MKNKKKSKLLFGLVLVISFIAALIASFINPTVNGAMAGLLNLKTQNTDGTPVRNKSLKVNGDGTYTLALDVTGDAEKITSRKANIVVVFDVSGSMKNVPSGSNQTRLQAAKNAVNNLANKLLSENGRMVIQVTFLKWHWYHFLLMRR